MVLIIRLWETLSITLCFVCNPIGQKSDKFHPYALLSLIHKDNNFLGSCQILETQVDMDLQVQNIVNILQLDTPQHTPPPSQKSHFPSCCEDQYWTSNSLQMCFKCTLVVLNLWWSYIGPGRAHLQMRVYPCFWYVHLNITYLVLVLGFFELVWDRQYQNKFDFHIATQ